MEVVFWFLKVRTKSRGKQLLASVRGHHSVGNLVRGSSSPQFSLGIHIPLAHEQYSLTHSAGY
jgi:hypothetical protein